MLGIFEEMDHFTPRKRIAYRQTVHVTNLCNFYDLDPQIVKTELQEFRHAYRAVQDIVPLKDLIPDDWKLELIDLYDAGTGSDDDDEQKTHLSTGQWIESLLC